MLAVDHHERLARYVKPTAIDGEIVDGGAFYVLPKDEGGLSFNRPSCFCKSANAFQEIEKRARIKLSKTGKYAVVLLSEISEALFEELEREIVVVEDALPETLEWVEDISHCLMMNMPHLDEPQVEMIGDIIAQHVADLVPVSNCPKLVRANLD